MARSRTAPATGQEAQGDQSPEPQEAPQAASTPSDGAPVVVDPAFTSAVSEAVSQRDPQTGTLPTANIEAVRKAYRALDGANLKRAAKQVLADGMKEGMDKLDISLARAFDVLIREAAVAGGTSGQPKTPADPTEAHVNLVVLLDLARTLDVPEGVSPEWEQKRDALYGELAPQLTTYRTWLNQDEESRGDEPEVSDLVKQAARLQSGRKARRSGGNGYTGTRRDIAKHIAEAFADKASGTFLTVSEIVGHKSTEYGDDKPSPGAVLARLFPTSGKVTIEGVTPGQNEKSVRGATKN